MQKSNRTDRQKDSTVNNYSDSPSKEGASIKRNSKLRVPHISTLLHHQDILKIYKILKIWLFITP